MNTKIDAIIDAMDRDWGSCPECAAAGEYSRGILRGSGSDCFLCCDKHGVRWFAGKEERLYLLYGEPENWQKGQFEALREVDGWLPEKSHKLRAERRQRFAALIDEVPYQYLTTRIMAELGGQLFCCSIKPNGAVVSDEAPEDFFECLSPLEQHLILALMGEIRADGPPLPRKRLPVRGGRVVDSRALLRAA